MAHGFTLLSVRWRDPVLTALTFLLAVLLFIVAPLHAAGVIHSQIFGFAMVLVVVGGCIVVTAKRVAIAAMLVGLGLAGTSAVLRLSQHSVINHYLDASAFLMVSIALSSVISRAVFAPGRVTYHRVMGAILLYLTIGVIFVALFMGVGLLSAGAFGGVAPAEDPALVSNLIYFSFVTLTSTGYGDIVPVHPVARGLCNIEAIIGQLYPATLLARLVTLELADQR
jgi:hypothetical protein